MPFDRAHLNAAHDEWKTKTPEERRDYFEVGIMRTKGSFKTLCGRTIEIRIAFRYELNGNKYSYKGMDTTTFIEKGIKLEIDHHILERYAEEIDDFMDNLVNERIAEEA